MVVGFGVMGDLLGSPGVTEGREEGEIVGLLVVGRSEGLFEGIAVGRGVGLLDVGAFVGE